jgi:hypothetical protein
MRNEKYECQLIFPCHIWGRGSAKRAEGSFSFHNLNFFFCQLIPLIDQKINHRSHQLHATDKLADIGS